MHEFGICFRIEIPRYSQGISGGVSEQLSSYRSYSLKIIEKENFKIVKKF